MELMTASSEAAWISSMGGRRTLQEERLPYSNEAKWQNGHRGRLSGLWETTPGPRTTLTGEDAKAYRFRTTCRFVMTWQFTATGRFETTWQCRSTKVARSVCRHCTELLE